LPCRASVLLVEQLLYRAFQFQSRAGLGRTKQWRIPSVDQRYRCDCCAAEKSTKRGNSRAMAPAARSRWWLVLVGSIGRRELQDFVATHVRALGRASPAQQFDLGVDERIG